MTAEEEESPDAAGEETTGFPGVRSWRTVYIVVLIALAVYVVLLMALARSFA